MRIKLRVWAEAGLGFRHDDHYLIVNTMVILIPTQYRILCSRFGKTRE